MIARVSGVGGRRVLAAALIVLLVAQLASVTTLMRRTHVVSVDQVVERFREETAASGAPSSGVLAVSSAAPAPTAPQQVATVVTPSDGTAHDAAAGGEPVHDGRAVPDGEDGPVVAPAGVYVYATSGFEEIGLPGGRRGYPERTTMTIRHTDCGADIRWDVFEERWALWETCSPHRGIELRAFTTHHEFFRQTEHRRYECTPGSELRPSAEATGSAAHGQCDDGHATVELTSVIVGTEAVEVGGTRVEAVHVRFDEVLTGNTTGTRSGDSWFRSSDGLLLRRTSVTDVESETVVGHTSYREEVTLDLLNLEPRT